MATIDLFDNNRKKLSEIELKDEIFNAEIKSHLFYETIKMQLANKRRGTASTKNRSKVKGGGKKPWRQKGTGRARAGTIRSPLWVGGGVVFGPMPRSYSYSLSKKAKRTALKSALSLKFKENKLLLVDSFNMDTIKTKEFVKTVTTLGITNGLIVDESDQILHKSARNVPGFKVLKSAGLNVYDILKYNNVIITKNSLAMIERRLLS